MFGGQSDVGHWHCGWMMHQGGTVDGGIKSAADAEMQLWHPRDSSLLSASRLWRRGWCDRGGPQSTRSNEESRIEIPSCLHLHNLLANLYFPKLKNEHGTEPFKVVVRLLLHLLILQGLASSGPRSNKSTRSVTAVQVRRPLLWFPPNFGSENFPGFRASHLGLFAHFYGRPCYSRTVSWAAGPAL